MQIADNMSALLDSCDGFEMENGCSRLVGFFHVEGEVEAPVIEIIRIDEGLVDR